jgi:hypothetical protein
MAYMNKEKKAKLMPAIKSVLKKYGMKGTVSVRHYSSLVVKLPSGDIDFGSANVDNPANEGKWRGHESVNVYWIDTHYTGKAAEFLKELKAAMSEGNHDNSDIMTDYFDVGWYVDINIGNWEKPYVWTGARS